MSDPKKGLAYILWSCLFGAALAMSFVLAFEILYHALLIFCYQR